jgi:hypothetical protein
MESLGLNACVDEELLDRKPDKSLGQVEASHDSVPDPLRLLAWHRRNTFQLHSGIYHRRIVSRLPQGLSIDYLSSF